MTLRQLLCALRPDGHKDDHVDVEPQPDRPGLFVRCLTCGYTSPGVRWDVPVSIRKAA